MPTTTIDAVYEGGILRLAHPIDLADGSAVEVIVIPKGVAAGAQAGDARRQDAVSSGGTSAGPGRGESPVEGGILTMDEIRARYAPDWVLIGEPQKDEYYNILAGRVLFHSPDREEVYRKAIELRPGNFAFRFLGQPPEGVEFIL